MSRELSFVVLREGRPGDAIRASDLERLAGHGASVMRRTDGRVIVFATQAQLEDAHADDLLRRSRGEHGELPTDHLVLAPWNRS